MKWFIGCIGVCVAMLITFGLLALYSATYSKLEPRRSGQQTMLTSQTSGMTVAAADAEASWRVAPRNIQGMESLKKQAFFALLGVVLCILIATFFDYHFLNRPEVPIILLVLSAILLTAVFFPAVGGVRVKGASRWIQFGISFQPSELAKLSIIIFLSWYGSKYFSYITHFWRGLIVPMVVIMPLVLLIFREPDAGSTMFLLAIASCMLLIMGARWFYLAVPAGAMFVSLCVWLYYDPVRRARLFSWLDLEKTKYETGLQVYASLIGFGSGGIFGKGLGTGEQKMGFIPEDHTDFILPVIGEEMGLVATLLIVVLFAVFAYCGFRIATQTRDRFGSYLAIGITLMISLQAIINIGVVTNCLPNKGMPLPFISRGGSNIVILMLAVGLLLSVARDNMRKEAVEESFEEEIPDIPYPIQPAKPVRRKKNLFAKNEYQDGEF